MIEKYSVNTDSENYVLSISKHPANPDMDTVSLDLSLYDLTGYRILCHKLEGDKLIFDEQKYIEDERRREEEEREREATPSQIDMLEAQALYTALMTDTLLEG